MLNTEDFIKRLEYLMEYYNFTASSFADKISVQRSGISHLLSGRNKPSLDFVLKISEEFPDVNLYWLLNGKGSFLKNDITPALVSEPENDEKPNQPTEEIQHKTSSTKNAIRPDSKIVIHKIVFFYSDGSFKDFYPSE